MEPSVFACEACGARIEVAAPALERMSLCPVCLTPRVATPEPAERPHRAVGRQSGGVVTAGLLVVIVAVGGLAGLHRSSGVVPTPAAAAPAPPEPARVVALQAEVPAVATRTDAAVAAEPLAPPAAAVEVVVQSSASSPAPAASVEAAPVAPSRPREALAPRSSPIRRRALPLPQVDPNDGEPLRVRVRTESGEFTVARVVGSARGQVGVLLPDGRVGAISGQPQYTNEPFQPTSMDQIRQELTADGRPFARFHVKQSRHYLVLYQSTPAFAEASLRLLEGLYRGLFEAFRRRSVPVHEAEFPLVAIIFRTERDFRANARGTLNGQAIAYYEVGSNRVYMYQTSDRDRQDPDHAALLKPETVAHEGTHQVLQNIGVQPRPSDWPPWLIEGLAEYCAPPTMTRRGAAWAGLGQVHIFDLAALRRIGDPWSSTAKLENRPSLSPVQRLVSQSALTTHDDYARAWALTHYLAQRRGPEFLAYLKAMGRVPPLGKLTPDDHLAAFRAAFGADLAKIDRAIAAHLAGLKLDLPVRRGEGRAVDRAE